jgi:hypothetical protein
VTVRVAGPAARSAIAVAAATSALAIAGCDGGESSGEVEAAVVRAYRAYAGRPAASASCARGPRSDDGSVEWWCDVQADDPLGADPCTVDVRTRADGTVTARITYCISEDE